MGDQGLTDRRGAEGPESMNHVQTRPLAERRKAATERLRSESNLWLATASDGRGPHLIPLAYWWDGSRLTTATFEGSRTDRSPSAVPTARIRRNADQRMQRLQQRDAVMWCAGPRHAHHQSGTLGHLGMIRPSLRATSGLSQVASANNPSAIRPRTTRGKRS